MNMDSSMLPGDNQQQNTPAGKTGNAGQEEVQISQPNLDRPEGPFEHSGETSGWTEEEKIEKIEDEGQ